MWKTFDADREYLENKYHKTSEPFDSFDRMHYHGYEYDPSTGLDDDEIKAGIAELYTKIENEPHSIIKARAVEYVLDNTRIDVNEHDYFIGIYSWGRVINDSTVFKWNKEVFEQKVPETAKFMNKHRQAGTLDIWADYDHSVPDWDAIFTLGFSGLLERAEMYRNKHKELTAKQKAFFDSISIEYKAILRFMDRLYKYALTKKHEKAKKIAACVKRLHDGKPETTYDILQMIYIYFMISESIESYQVRSLGSGLDAALDRYIRNDLNNGTYTEDELHEFIAYFLMQYSAIGNYWGQPFYLGGTDENGESMVKDTTYAIVDIYDKINIYNPKIQVKVNHNTPEKFINVIMNMIRKGRSSFVFVCEPAVLKSMMSLGLTYTEARTCDIKGCYEFAVRAGEISTAPMHINLLKPVLLVLNDGVDTITGGTVGLKTGGLENFPTFDDFYKAYMKQLEYVFEEGVKAVDQFEIYLDEINPSPMFSATIENSLQTMKDGYAFGSKYNNTVIVHTGFASAIDSLMALKTLVYDEKLVTLDELKMALDSNWVGYEKLRHKAQQCKYKFGNNETTADLYATALSKWLCMKENLRPNVRGGHYKSAMHSARHYIKFGQKTEASPDGRKAGEEESKNISPVMGMDRQGVTSLINSVIKIDPSLYTEDFCLDVMLHSSAANGEEGLAAMRAVLDTYMNNNGLAIQFNVFSTETLYDAQAHPEKYENLQVRVCGWNVLWNNLSREEQDAYIYRCENIQ